ncbi:putative urb2 npa2 family protein [Rosellinia necatrix]|uniref:Putative urb2 npa2 family protein n=1 Tax=Rosellinia necatrix TaxID=77044 RepID=A0A1W2TEV9_ROSNE|nr:putative urb2 npa2 family protein [Rosellinia necatrix]
MEAMEVDEDGSSRQLALIRAVRTLDEDSAIALPEKIHKLWLLLAAAKYTRLHGVEENILRWLLKQMTGSTDSAELVRRFPLTWTILGHIFPKIPAQALGRSLAYFRFVSILSKTLGDTTTKPETQASALASVLATQEDTASRKKRKRGADWPATLEELRTPLGCLRTASEVFEALAVLLEQAAPQSGELTAEKRVGAEHIKSLFSASADETRDIASRLLLVCDDSLSLADGEPPQNQPSWTDILTAIWNLRLHSKDDSLEFAKYIYERACLVLAKLDIDDSCPPPNHISSVCRATWIPQLRKLLSTYFIRPARQRFAADKNVDILKLALDIAQKNVATSTTVMWSIASRAPRDTSDPKSKIEHDAWIEKIFQVVVQGLKPLGRREKNDVLCRLLNIALETQSIPDTETLSVLYQQDVLGGSEMDWTLLSKILACDADVFLVAQDLATIFDKVSGVPDVDTKKDEVVSSVIIPLQDAFSNARDLAEFITQWFRSLCAAEHVNQSIWFDPKIREHLATILQTSLSGAQLLRLLEALEQIPNESGELLVILDGICAGLSDENTIASVDSKIISLMDREWGDLSSDVLALRWRVLGCLASWETSNEGNQLWKKIKSDLKSTLKKKSLTATETFEAFSCCYRFCLSNHIGGKYEEDLTKLISIILGRLISSINNEADLRLLKPYVDLVFSQLPRLSEQPKQKVNTLTDYIVKLFWCVGHKLPLSSNELRLEYVRRLISNSDVTDEEPMVDALLAPLLDTLDTPETQCGWTQPHSTNLLLVLLEFPVESWTRGRRKRMMGSWRKQKSTISSHAAKNPTYALAVLRLLVKIMQQPTFYEDMEFADLVDICSSMTTSDATLLSLVERFVDATIRQVLTNTNDFTRPYLLDASQYAKSLKVAKHSVAYAQVILLKSLAAALKDHISPSTSLDHLGIDPGVFQHKLAKVVKQSLSEFASEVNESSVASLTNEKLSFLSMILNAAQTIGNNAAPETNIELSGDIQTRLERAGNTMITRDVAIAWKLRSFLMNQSADRYTTESFSAVLDESGQGVEEQWIYAFVDAYVQGKSQSVRDQLLDELIGRDELIRGSIGPLLATRRLLELYQGPSNNDISASIQKGPDLAKVHGHFTAHLSRTESLVHFKQISETVLFLLDKHGNAMTQYNIEATLTSVVEVCSIHGPKIKGPRVAGEIFAALFKLVALIIKRHRLRLNGHFHILLTALRALLTVLLADPALPASDRRPARSRHHPPWLLTRLEPRHGERFARLLTLVCEPSAASVTRSRSRSGLDSATDVAKRAAGQHMYLVLEVYVKLQLEAEVSRDMRKALEIGVFSVLDITPEGCRKVLNESLDAAGRAVFRALFAEYRKFGKWKGV